MSKKIVLRSSSGILRDTQGRIMVMGTPGQTHTFSSDAHRDGVPYGDVVMNLETNTETYVSWYGVTTTSTTHVKARLTYTYQTSVWVLHDVVYSYPPVPSFPYYYNAATLHAQKTALMVISTPTWTENYFTGKSTVNCTTWSVV